MTPTEASQPGDGYDFPIQLADIKRARFSKWFPHVPIAVFTATLGLTEALPYLIKPSFFHEKILTALYQSQSLTSITVLPHLYMGGILLIISIGLFFRFRYAYLASIFILGSSVLINYLVPGHKLSIYQAFLQIILLSVVISCRYTFTRVNLGTSILFSFASVSLVISYATLFSYEMGDQFHPPITEFSSAFYFSLVTMSTVGFGDIVPLTVEARLFTISYVILGITVLATSLSAVVMPIINSKARSLLMPDSPKIPKADHLIIIGNNPLAMNTLKELSARAIPLVAIYPNQTTQLDGSTIPAPPIDNSEPSLSGDPTDSDLLNQANIKQAKAVLALTSSDALNVFICLLVKELNESVQTVVAVNNSNSLQRVKRIRPDVIISADTLAGELLAMALTGEKPNPNEIWSKLFYLHNNS